MIISNYLAQETTIKLSDIKYIFASAICYGTYRIFMNKYFLTPLSKFVAEKNRNKFIHRGFDCIHYIICGMVGILSFLQRPYSHCAFFFGDCQKYNICTGEFVCSVFQKIYIFLFASYYISDVFWIHTTKDIFIMCIHHTITLSMTIICILAARPVAGISTMVLHDFVDIFLYTGKIATYFNMKKIGDTSLIIFAISFFYLRLVNLLIILVLVIVDKTEQPHHKILYIIGRTMVIILYGCHLIWGSQIIKAIINVFKGDKIRDIRSDEGVKKE